MTKAELIEEVSKVVEMTRKDSETIVETIFDSIVNSLHKGDKIEIRGFGSFRTRQRQPRIGREVIDDPGFFLRDREHAIRRSVDVHFAAHLVRVAGGE